MKILMTTQPGLGHLRPLAALGRILLERGHDVRVACPPRFSDVVRSVGLSPLPAGYDFVISEASQAFPDMPPAGPARMPWMIPFFYRRTAVRTARDLIDLRRQFDPDLVIRDYLEVGGTLFGEICRVPHVAAGPIWFRGEPAVRESLRDACLDLGLPPAGSEQMLFRHGAIAAQPPWWNAPDEVVPGGVTYVRPSAPPGAGVAPSWMSALDATAPLVHVTLGTTEANRTPGLYRTIVDALRDESVEVVVSMGREFDRTELGPVSDRVHVHEMVEHGHLLPRCAVVVSNGGYGTLMASLAHGVPSVVVPIQADQPRNAKRMVDLGLGVSVGRSEWTSDAVRRAVRSVLDDDAYRLAAHRARRSLERLPFVESVVEQLERLRR
ncbi:MAG: glycosyltransferase [Polyangiaceae bacterium]